MINLMAKIVSIEIEQLIGYVLLFLLFLIGLLLLIPAI